MSKKIEITEKSYYRLLRCTLAYQSQNRGGICGQAFTSFECAVCGNIDSHPNTCTPNICVPCEKISKAKIKELYEAGYFEIDE